MAFKSIYRLFENVPVAPSKNGPMPVVPVEARSGPWTGNQGLGSARTWNPSLVGRQSIFKMPEWGMPRVWTVSLGIATPANVYSDGTLFDVTGTIIFGAGGATQTIEVDWIQGACVLLPANTIEVVASLHDQASVYTDEINLSVLVAQGSVGVPSATRTVFASIPAGTSTVVIVPPFAKWFSVLNASVLALGQTPSNSASMLYDIAGSATTGNLAYIYGNMLVEFGGVIPIPALARVIRVTNLSAADAFVRLVFGLAY